MPRRSIYEQMGDAERRNGAAGNGHAQQRPAPPARLRASLARDVPTLPVEWLWRGYLPAGAVTVFDGDPGRGKSTLAIDLAARVSNGWPMPPEPGGTRVCEPAGVLLLTAEDDGNRTVKPRLEAAGADVDRVAIIDGVDFGDGDRPLSLPEDLGLLASAAEEIDARLLVCDPVSAFLSQRTDTNKDADVRRAFHELKRFAAGTGLACALVRHLNKLSSEPSAMYRGCGSIAVVAAARAAFVVGQHPDDERQRVLAPVKCNLGPMPPSLAFTVEPHGTVSRIGWVGPCSLTADQIISRPNPGRPGADIAEAADFLRERLSGGPKPTAEVEKAARKAGVSLRTLDRARRELGVVARKVCGTWILCLDGDDDNSRTPPPE
jgi:hypothetical protein